MASFRFSSTSQESIGREIGENIRFKALRHFDFNAAMVEGETKKDERYVKWLFNNLKRAKDLEHFKFSFVFLFDIGIKKKFSSTVYAVQFKNLLRMNKLKILQLGFNLLKRQQQGHIWRIIGSQPTIKSLRFSVFNPETGCVGPYLFDSTANKIKLDSLSLSFYYPTFDIYLLTRFSSSIKIKTLSAFRSDRTRVNIKDLTASLSYFVKYEPDKAKPLYEAFKRRELIDYKRCILDT